LIAFTRESSRETENFSSIMAYIDMPSRIRFETLGAYQILQYLQTAMINPHDNLRKLHKH